MLSVAYGAGLRVSEVAHLKADDINSKRMLIRIEEEKGRKDRNAMLSPQLLEPLRLWWREGKRRSVLLSYGWRFPGRSCTDLISTRQLHRAVCEAADAAGIRKRVSPHTDAAVLREARRLRRSGRPWPAWTDRLRCRPSRRAAVLAGRRRGSAHRLAERAGRVPRGRLAAD